jgi:hypothetical protein
MGIPSGYTSGQVVQAVPSNNVSAFTAYTPTFTNFTLGNGTVDAQYIEIGKFVFVYGLVILGSTSSVTGQIQVSLPVTSATMTRQQQFATFTDTGTGNFTGNTSWGTTTLITLNALKTDSTYLSAVNTSSTVPFTWTNTDQFAFGLMYEAA